MKKQIFLSIVILVSIQAVYGQRTEKGENRPVKSQFVISGKIGHLNSPAKLYLQYQNEGKAVSDSCTLTDGNFRFTGVLSGITAAEITLSREGNKMKELYSARCGDAVYPYFGNEMIAITSPDSLHNATWKGSEVHDQMIDFEKQVGPGKMALYWNSKAEYNNLTLEQKADPSYIQALGEKIDQLKKNRGVRLLEFAKGNPNSIFSIEALMESFNEYHSGSSVVMPVFDQLNASVKNSNNGKKLLKLLQERQQITGSNKPSKYGIPPKTWKEHWFEHDQTLDLVYYDDHVAFYYDDKMDRSVSWPFETLSLSWNYIKKTYGAIGNSGRLYVVLHQGRYAGGHPGLYFDGSHDYRNTLDCGLLDWTTPTGQQIGMPLHEIGHIVCSASNGVQGASSDIIWGDSKFMEIFVYDILMNIGRQDEAAIVFQQLQNKDPFEEYPGIRYPGVRWFADWFYPIYKEYGKGTVLSRYFKIIAENYPRSHDKVFDDSHKMNMGEFVHFWSGAAGADLSNRAKATWGKYWTPEVEDQLNKAKAEFPKIIY